MVPVVLALGQEILKNKWKDTKNKKDSDIITLLFDCDLIILTYDHVDADFQLIYYYVRTLIY